MIVIVDGSLFVSSRVSADEEDRFPCNSRTMHRVGDGDFLACLTMNTCCDGDFDAPLLLHTLEDDFCFGSRAMHSVDDVDLFGGLTKHTLGDGGRASLLTMHTLGDGGRASLLTMYTLGVGGLLSVTITVAGAVDLWSVQEQLLGDWVSPLRMYMSGVSDASPSFTMHTRGDGGLCDTPALLRTHTMGDSDCREVTGHSIISTVVEEPRRDILGTGVRGRRRRFPISRL